MFRAVDISTTDDSSLDSGNWLDASSWSVGLGGDTFAIGAGSSGVTIAAAGIPLDPFGDSSFAAPNIPIALRAVSSPGGNASNHAHSEHVPGTSYDFNVSSGDWNVPTNWNPEGVPGSNDQAEIDTGDNAIVDSPVTVSQLFLEGGTVSVDSGDTLTLTGGSTFAGTINGAGTLAFVGGTDALSSGASLGSANLAISNGAAVTVNANVTDSGTTSEDGSSTITIGSGDTLTLSGTGSSLAGMINGAGTLAFTGGTQALNSGATLTVANWTTSGSDVASMNENMSYGGTFSADAGTTLTIASGDTVTLTGSGSNIAGTISGGGALAFTGGSQSFDNGAVLLVTSWTMSGNDVTRVDENLTYAGSFSDASGTALTIDSGGTLTLALFSNSTIAGVISGSGTLNFAGLSNQVLNSGAELTVSNWTISDQGDVVVNENLKYAGTFSDGMLSTLSIASGDRVAFTGTSTFAGDISGSGTLTFASGIQEIVSPATILAVSEWTISDNDVTVFYDSLDYGGLLAAGAGTDLALRNNTLTLSGVGSGIVGSVTGSGTLAFTGGTQGLDGGAGLTIANWTTSGNDVASINEALTYAGQFSGGAGTRLMISSGDALTLTGASTFSGTVSGAGTLAFAGSDPSFDSGAALTVSNLTISGSGTAYFNENLTYAGSLSDGAGTTLSLGANTLTLKGAASGIAGTVSGAGTLAFAGGTQALNSGAVLTVSNWTTSGSDAANIDENLSYGGAFSAGTGATLSIAFGDTLTLAGSSTIAGAVSGAGTLALSGGMDTLKSGASLGSNSLTMTNGASVAVNASVVDGSITAEAAGTTISIGNSDKLSLSGSGSTIAGTVSGAGTLAFTGGSQAFDSGASLTISQWTTSGSDALSVDENLTYAGAFSAGYGTTLSVASGDTFILTGSSTLAGAIDGAGTLGLSGGTVDFSASVSLALAALSTSNGAVVTVGAYVADTGAVSVGSGTSISIGSSDALKLSGSGSSFAGTIVGAGTLLFAGGSQMLNSGAALTVSNWTASGGDAANVDVNLSYGGTFSAGSGTSLSIASGDTLTLTGTSTFADTIDGAGTLALSGGADTFKFGAVLAPATLAITNGAIVTIAGNVTDSGAVSEAAGTTISIGAGNTLSLSGSGSMIAGLILGAGTLAFAGGSQTLNSGASLSVAKWSLSGGDVATVDENLVYAGAFSANSGTILSIGSGDALTFDKAIGGSGIIEIGASSTLTAELSSAATLATTFEGADGTLALAKASGFHATIDGFVASDTIDLLDTSATSATLETGDELVIKNGNTTVATLQLSSNYTGYTFSVGSDGNGGTDVTTNAPAEIQFHQNGQTFTSNGEAANIAIQSGTWDDTFTFNGNFGTVTIAGYIPGSDIMNFDHNDFANIAAVEAHATQDAHGDTVITLGADDIITLVGVSLNQFEAHASDWHFI